MAISQAAQQSCYPAHTFGSDLLHTNEVVCMWKPGRCWTVARTGAGLAFPCGWYPLKSGKSQAHHAPVRCVHCIKALRQMDALAQPLGSGIAKPEIAKPGDRKIGDHFRARIH